MSSATATLDFLQPAYTQISTQFHVQQKIMWCFMDPKPRSCFSFALLEDLRRFQLFMETVNRRDMEAGLPCPIQYMVLTSRNRQVFSFGGDLELFSQYIQERNRSELLRYAKACIDVVYPNSVNYDLPMTSISLVRGDALGGGFEAALSGNVLIAEKGAQFGLPEILFNMFPGMGAYSLLARRIGAFQAEKIITSGSVYSAEEMHRMGVVDVLAEEGQGENAVCEFVVKRSRKRNALQSLLKVRQRYLRIDRNELTDIAEIWVDSALNLGPKDLRLMERLVRAQERMQEDAPGAAATEIRA
jgi:DSF synthase